jgi:phosphate transport system substrate-binding protein
MKTLLFGLAFSTLVGSGSNLTGSGASFPAPLYTEMFRLYGKNTGIAVNYAATGSGKGQEDILTRRVDFAGSDAYLTDEQLRSAPGEILHLPMALDAVVPVYNLPGVTKRLQFNGQTLADIYLGKIKNWNDSALQKINPGVQLPNLSITPVYRSDSSGTTSIFVDFLGKTSGTWAQTVSRGPRTSVNWRAGVGAEKTSGLVKLVQGRSGAIGYVGSSAAKSNKMMYGLVANRTGEFVDGGDLREVSNTASVITIPADTRVSLVNADIGYPISGFTWLLVYRDQKYGNRTKAQAKQLVSLLRWMIDEGQQVNPRLNYGPVDGPATTKAFQLIENMTFGNEKL